MLKLLSAVAAFAVLSACGQKEGDGNATAVANPYGLSATEDAAMEVAAADATAGTATGEASKASESQGPQIAYSFGLGYRLPAAEIPNAQAAHVALCDAMGAARCRIVFQSRSDQDGGYATGTLTLQVEAAKARDFADQMDKVVAGKGGQVSNRQMSAEDLSKQIIDIEARIAAKEALAGRLLEILNRRDGKVADLVEAERAYAEVQEELDAARATMEDYSRRVRMSEVTADYQAVRPSGAAAGRPVAEALSAAGRTFGSSVAVLISFLVAALPWLLLGALIVWPLRTVVRRWRARRLKPETPASGQ